jgi:hypothetical protein
MDVSSRQLGHIGEEGGGSVDDSDSKDNDHEDEYTEGKNDSSEVSMMELVKSMLPTSDLLAKTKKHSHDAAALAGLAGRYQIGKTIKTAVPPDEREQKLRAGLAR